MTHTRVIANAILGVGLAASVAFAQGGGAKPPVADSSTARRDTLESVIVRATRTPTAPTAAKQTVTREQIQRTAAGQDAPLVLASTPSATVYSEAGGYSGYSYIRLRGIDQTRLNITIDGVPLNDPEDQVLYFSNVPDFMGSIGSVDVGRGVGASTFGTASYAGSLNFQSLPLATTPRSGQVEFTGGSFGTWRTSVQGATGVNASGLAAYGRFTRQGTSGYREHSGNDAWSGFGSAGWFGARDAVKVSGFAGSSGTREAYLAASEAELKENRRVNPLTNQEGDRFHQEMVSLQYTHAFTAALNATVMTYRNSAAGAYDVSFGPSANGQGLDIANYGLAHVWSGATAALTWTSSDVAVAAGATASDYHRDHWLAMRPTLNNRDYTNTGVKRDASGFIKLTWDRGPLRFGADLNLRHADFRYRPSSSAGIASQTVGWSFANPRGGVMWTASPTVSLYATAGRTLREPARGDLFAGADDLNSGNAAGLLPLTRVHPEELNDFEGGIIWRGAIASLTANLFDMEFRNEIAPIGALSQTGSPLRKNVPRSYRRGLELDGSYALDGLGVVTGNIALMKARIAAYVDDAAGNSFLDVPPVATAPLLANVRWDVPLAGPLSLSVAGRYVDRTHLANDDNPVTVTPAYSLVDLAVRYTRGASELRVELNNALDANAYAGGYADSGTRYFYPIATRNVLVTLRLATGGTR
jgi:iron complex outermembrane receptor protein